MRRKPLLIPHRLPAFLESLMPIKRRSKEVNTPELIGQRVRVRVRVTMLMF